MKPKAPPLKPRNGHVAAMRKRAAGAHGKTRKAERRALKQDLRREARDVPESGPSDAFPNALRS